eukprot:201361_1
MCTENLRKQTFNCFKWLLEFIVFCLFGFWLYSWYFSISIVVRRNQIPHVKHLAECSSITIKDCSYDADTDGYQRVYWWKITNTTHNACEGITFKWTESCQHPMSGFGDDGHWNIKETHIWYSDEKCGHWMSHAEKVYVYSFWFWVWISVSGGPIVICCVMCCCYELWQKWCYQIKISKFGFGKIKQNEQIEFSTKSVGRKVAFV